ncbi:tryptophan transporter [Bacillus sp. REN16]|uniref:tryptophan transporter n=1 Tax=Bacillus sp. REN16 TaxID=2887296 RepID=UPI001E4660EA|nr:tryptophan transporter [Bacillus sp. REN16]MCC3355430.1 tryptophan transporter [Bacillus sp. REN16]
MNTKVLVFLSLLVGMGAVLHTVIPPIYLGMKPDLMLIMMFLGIMLFPEKKYVLLVAIVAGVISALTTNFPGGQIANPVDKLVSAFVFYGIFLAARKHTQSLVMVCTVTAVGILVSGTVFLTTALFIAGLPGTFIGLFIGVVIPATVMGTIAMAIIHPVAHQIIKRTNFTVSA